MITGNEELPEKNSRTPDETLRNQMLFNIQEASRMLGGMPPTTIRKLVKRGVLKRCENTGDRPFYFTKEQIHNFVNNQTRTNHE